jgi:hypothetical protein
LAVTLNRYELPDWHGERNAGDPCDLFTLGAGDVLRPAWPPAVACAASCRARDHPGIPTVRMSSVSVPEACLKNLRGTKIIATPTQMRAAATVISAKVPEEYSRAIRQH